ncbi:hypothetical protein MTCOM_08390 [Moorella thermoacetica]|uniref:hypothetical protein n=1 Tax=Neomoorella thermoacetica TaxID=1525 RepID=UPI0008FB4768|nr:hypothetical protein [Moorella thermoacetica]OIQ62069.1 hypothetical protein MTIN_09080 [Moorella thermoacetica]
MDFMPWTALVFQSIPESIVLVALGLGLVGEYPEIPSIIIIGIIGSVTSFFIRRLPLDFGGHTLLSMIVLIILMRFILKITVIKGILAAFFGILAVGIIESMSIPIVSYLTGISFETALHDPWLRVVFPLPDEIILGVAAYLCRRWRFTLVSNCTIFANSSREEKDDEK